MTEFISFRAPTRPSSARLFRYLGGAFACLLASFGIWVTATEWLRTDGPISTMRTESGQTGSGHDDAGRVRLAAAVGVVRAELWTEYAVRLRQSAQIGPEAATMRDEARRAGETAVGLSPLDTEAWLVLSELAVDGGAAATASTGLLNMSFLTGPNAIDLMPRRLALVARAPAHTDRDIRGLALRDVQILARQADGPVRLRALWRDTSPEGRKFLAELLQDVAGQLLGNIRNTR
ncbi:hypothetical protein RA307_22090 [Xanthobacteraceae bacterium Astr-EGSB]|uniref:hypothetical protein n=1 Tax=Astrobacterium formosum TaxID=3069710 RepID=UPI0027B809B9|nr:hypothetical protein [Xanthobacteraceae bacterium Astr-EGSB]